MAVSAAILEIFTDTHKSRMNGLSCGEESITICSAVLIQCQRVMERQTDGRTEGQMDGRQAYSYYVLQQYQYRVSVC